ncbi:RimK family alpha-L-glutamate ligase [Streptacidiphilus sp. EB103A]|uniref:ATP-grasp domain-containing protein n=1 Tax=Streptacidiphilus sp. EB103A TaxID=3156275 RepID=UPI003517D72D
MADIALLTGRTMPREVPENGLLVAELGRLGVTVEIHPWDEPLDWAGFGLAVVRTTWDYWSRSEEFAAWAERTARLTTLRNPVEVLLWNSHKGYLVELAAAGVPVVPTRLVPRGASDAERGRVLLAFGDDEVVLKPAVSAGARGALRSLAADDVSAAHLAELTGVGDALVQPFAESVLARGETSLVFFDGAFSHAVRKIPAAGEYRIHLHHGGSVQQYAPDAAELAVAAAALAAAPAATSYARVDLVQLPGGPAVMELELIEPELFLPTAPAAAGRYARVLADLLDAR